MMPKTKNKIKKIIMFIINLALGLIFISPLIVGLCFSFQEETELATYPLKLFTDSPTLQNYIEVFQKVPLLSYLKNSAIICGITISSQIIISCLAAYGFAFFDFPFKKLLFSLVLMTTMIPGEVVVITNYTTVQNWNLNNTYAGLSITSLISGMAIFLMRQYFMTLPKDFKDAAQIDGCGELRFLFHVALPLSAPTIASLAIYLFVQIYNQYFWPLLITNSNEMRTVQIGISFLVAGDTLNYGHILAGAVVAILPTAIIYILGQDYIIKGMTSGGIKG